MSRIPLFRSSFLLMLILWQSAAMGHQGYYETSRLRQGSFWESSGANAPYYVDEGCPIPGAGCRFARSEDWTFDRPVQLVEELEVPNPGRPGVPSDIMCTTDSDCSGSCIANNNSEMVCDLAPGTARPNIGVVYRSRLVGPRDIDWGIWNYSPNMGKVPMVLIPSVGACVENLNKFPSVVIAGPINLLDPDSGERIFAPPRDFDFLPTEIINKIKSLDRTYGIRLVQQRDDYVPSEADPRPGYFSIFGPGASLYFKGTSVDPCVENYQTCLNNPESDHFDYNDFFFLENDEPVSLYYAVWDEEIYALNNEYRFLRQERDQEKARIFSGQKYSRDKLIKLEAQLDKFIVDVGLVMGTRDSMTSGDSLRQSYLGAATGGGRNNHGTCTNPVPTGKVDVQKYPEEN
jgi:hypothetical protein